MKILHISSTDIGGGAGRATLKLHAALLRSGIDSKVLVQNKFSDGLKVFGPNNLTQKFFSKARPTLDLLLVKKYKNRTKTQFSPSLLLFSGIIDRINEFSPDIVHLHWICSGMLSIKDLEKISVPIVWNLRDMWPFTGGCHYDEGCGGYLNKCGNCVVLGSKRKHDLSSRIFSRKRYVYSKLKNLTVVGLSHWITNCAKNSNLFREKNVVNLPNPIDTLRFQPIEKKFARKILSLPQDKKVILYGAMEATSEPRKGYNIFIESLKKLSIHNYEFVVFGRRSSQDDMELTTKVHYVGQLYDDISLQILYSAADVVIVPSIQENLSNVILESLSCGTPVVGFNVGGNCDMIEHKNNGYLAEPFSTDDLATGIEWVLSSKNYKILCSNARSKVLKEFDSAVVASKYIELYHQILNEEGATNIV